jgi:hypothetical protein
LLQHDVTSLQSKWTRHASSWNDPSGTCEGCLESTIKFDKHVQKMEMTRRLDCATPQTFQVYQLFLPTDGVGWSANALEQNL